MKRRIRSKFKTEKYKEKNILVTGTATPFPNSFCFKLENYERWISCTRKAVGSELFDELKLLRKGCLVDINMELRANPALPTHPNNNISVVKMSIVKWPETYAAFFKPVSFYEEEILDFEVSRLCRYYQNKHIVYYAGGTIPGWDDETEMLLANTEKAHEWARSIPVDGKYYPCEATICGVIRNFKDKVVFFITECYKLCPDQTDK